MVRDGAKGVNYIEKCPLCGREGKERSDYCKKSIDIVLCPNKDSKCKNNEERVYNNKTEHVRIGCWGYTCGNMSIGTFLGSNIMLQSYTNLTPRVTGIKNLCIQSFIEKIKKQNEEIIAALQRNPDIKESVINQHQSGFEMHTEQAEALVEADQDIYSYSGHPLYLFKRSVQSHHLICAEVFNDERWRALCKYTGYNSNCWKNGVIMTAVDELACYTGYPKHRGPHGKFYSDYVGGLLQSIYEGYEDGPCQKDDAKNFIEEINELSKDILDKIKDFKLRLTADGMNYKKNKGDNSLRIGCAEAGQHCDGTKHYISEANITRKQVENYNFEVGN